MRPWSWCSALGAEQHRIGSLALELHHERLQVLHLKADAIERPALGRRQGLVSLRKRKVDAGQVVAIDPTRPVHTRALAGQTAESFRVPGLHRRNIGGVEVNVIHQDRGRDGRVAENFWSNTIRRDSVGMIRIFSLLHFEVVRFPLRECRRHIFHNETEVIHDRPSRGRGERAAHDGCPEMPLSLDVFHGELNVPHTDAGGIRRGKLGHKLGQQRVRP